MIILDGSLGEGGGAIIRTALSLSALTGQSFSIDNIRKNRPRPGLMPQHLNAVHAVQKLCNAKVTGDEPSSQKLEFIPGKLAAQTISIDIGTAGSIPLLLQALLLPACFAPRKVRIKVTGGTDTKWSMPIDYFSSVFLPYVERCAEIDLKLVQRGYYPAGGGKIDLQITPRYKLGDFADFFALRNHLRKENLSYNLTKKGRLTSIHGISHSSSKLQDAQVSERQAKGAKKELASHDVPVRIQTQYCATQSPGSGICLWAVYDSGALLGGDALGEKGKQAELVGKEAAQALTAETAQDAPVDKWLADQLAVYLALLGGCYTATSITDHTLTNIYVIEQFLGQVISVAENTISS